MKKILCVILAAVMMFGVLAACGGGDTAPEPAAQPAAEEPAAPAEQPAAEEPAAPAEEEWEVTEEADTYVYPTGPRGEGVTIELWSFTDELPNEALRYKAENPDFLYDINVTIISDQDDLYIQALNPALMAGAGAGAPDMYVCEQAFVINYSKFDFADFALPYDDLFNVTPGSSEAMAAAADISAITKSAGTNPNGQLVALGYQSTGSALIYRRSIAEAVWGTDDPAVVATKVGPGYDKFTEAAAEVKAAGYAMVAGEGDIWQAIRQSPNQWIQNDKLVIDDQKMSYLDIGYTFYNNDYSLKAGAWGDAWNAAMGGTTDPEVFCFLGPAWLINYVMAGNSGDTFGDWAICAPPEPFCWGGSYSFANKYGNPDALPGVAELIYWITLDTSETGLQYSWAAGDTVGSGVVMDKVDGHWDFLGGQDAFEVFVPLGKTGTASGWGPYDGTINGMFQDHAVQYFNGTYADKDEMIAAFQQEVLDTLGFGS